MLKETKILFEFNSKDDPSEQFEDFIKEENFIDNLSIDFEIDPNEIVKAKQQEEFDFSKFSPLRNELLSENSDIIQSCEAECQSHAVILQDFKNNIVIEKSKLQ